MSVVITSDKLGGMVYSLQSYMHNFWGMLVEWEIRPANLPDWSSSADGRVETEKMFWEWMGSTQKTWSGFGRQWKYHLIPIEQRSALREDWIPPMYWAVSGAKAYALPQYPQERVRIPDPTDRFGRKRSIRVHRLENRK